MGRHAAPPTPGADEPAPRALTQTVAYGALALVVLGVVLLWLGTAPRTAAEVLLGVLVVGALAYLVVRRTGLLARAPGPAPGAHL